MIAGRIGSLRIALGFLQGIAGWLLLRLVPPTEVPLKPTAAAPVYWATRHPAPFVALALITALVPVIAVLEMGRMRWRTLLTYLALAALGIAGLAGYDIWRDPIEEYAGSASSVRFWPSFALTVCTVLGLFIVNQLLEHREHGCSLFEKYTLHFEDSWMRGFQFVVSLLFAGVAWGTLNLGAALFELIHIGGFGRLLGHNWVRAPFMATAFAAAIHITDVRPALLKGMRNVVLTLLSWLLPLVVAVSLGFLVALCFVGLKPLWETRRAASILLTACAFTVFLLNAAYKDGDPVTLPPAALRFVGRAAGPVLLPLAALALYAIVLRVIQHGWTPERVWSIVVALMALIYTTGYAFASAARPGWMRPLETVNVCASLAILALLVLLLTPLADPARISVRSQLSRLQDGRVSAEAFDYQFLRFDAAGYGRDALRELARSAGSDVRVRAAHMLGSRSRQSFGTVPDAAVTEAAFAHATVYPAGMQLPPGFRETVWSAVQVTGIPECMRNGRDCDIYVVAYGQPGEVAVIVHPTRVTPGSFSSDDVSIAQVFQRDAHGWVKTGFIDNMNCAAALAALQDGKATPIAPEHDDLTAAGLRLHFTAMAGPARSNCETTSPPKPPVPAHEARAPFQMGPAFGTQ